MKRTKKISIREYESPLMYDKMKQIQTLVNLESLMRWAKQPAPETPQVPKCADIKFTIGWWNFIRTVLRESKEGLRQLKP